MHMYVFISFFKARDLFNQYLNSNNIIMKLNTFVTKYIDFNFQHFTYHLSSAVHNATLKLFQLFKFNINFE